ncbi:hypothetical protein CBS147347_10875 [Aspergillus niger]|nr:hypothetical protein CBS147347_10875 [Aspergillus niger]
MSVVELYNSRLVLLTNPPDQPVQKPFALVTEAQDRGSGEKDESPLLSQAGHEELISYIVDCAIKVAITMKPEYQQQKYVTGLRLSDFGCDIHTQNPHTNIWNVKKSRMLLCFHSEFDLVSMDAFNEIVGHHSRRTSSEKIPIAYTQVGTTILRWAFGKNKTGCSTAFNIVMGLDVDLIIGWPSMRRLELYRANPLIAWRLRQSHQPGASDIEH